MARVQETNRSTFAVHSFPPTLLRYLSAHPFLKAASTINSLKKGLITQIFPKYEQKGMGYKRKETL